MLGELNSIAWDNRGARPSFFSRLDDIVDKIAAHLHSNGNGLAMNDIDSEEFRVISVIIRKNCTFQRRFSTIIQTSKSQSSSLQSLKLRLGRMSMPTPALIEEYFVSRLDLQNDRIEAIREGAHTYGFLAVKAAVLSEVQTVQVEGSLIGSPIDSRYARHWQSFSMWRKHLYLIHALTVYTCIRQSSELVISSLWMRMD